MVGRRLRCSTATQKIPCNERRASQVYGIHSESAPLAVRQLPTSEHHSLDSGPETWASEHVCLQQGLSVWASCTWSKLR